jgi:NAD(P)-dependent dehydrogenase (short-subunit alcohol dehydrogenase family)
LITGAARGIGAACARRLAREGARLVLADQDAAGVDTLAGELGQVALRADVTKPADIACMVDEPYRRWGRLDVLFNNAGVIRVQPMFDVTEADWDRVMDVNLRAVFFVLQAVAKRMVTQDLMPGSKLRGKLIATASIASYRGGNHLMTPYSASKAGVVSLTRSAAQLLAPERITSNCVCPARSRRRCGSRSTASGAPWKGSDRARRGSAASGTSRSGGRSGPRTWPAWLRSWPGPTPTT